MKAVVLEEPMDSKLPTEVMISEIESFKTRKSDGAATDRELFAILDKVSQYLTKLNAMEGHGGQNVILLAVAERCDEMESALGLQGPPQKHPPKKKPLLERLAAITTELEGISESVETICETLEAGDDKESLSTQLEVAATEVISKMNIREEVIDDVLELIDRRILPADDRVLRKKIEALRDGLDQYPLESNTSLENFAGIRIVCA